MASLAGDTCIVTGATGAIGKASASALVREGATVVMVCRDPHRGEAARSEVERSQQNGKAELVTGDFSDLGSVRTVAAGLAKRHPREKVLVNTAATFARERRVTRDGFESMFATNHLGPFLLTNLLLGPLKAAAPSRIITVSAPATTKLDFDDLQGERQFRTFNAFGASKMANLLFAFELARRLEGTGVTSNVLHPGIVRSGLMTDAPAFARLITRISGKSPEAAGQAVLYLASAPELTTTSGRFFKLTAPTRPPSGALDPNAQRRLWEVSEKLTGFSSTG